MRRRRVLHETIKTFEQSDPPDRYHRLAAKNLERWWTESRVSRSKLQVEVLPDDWGEVIGSFMRTYGTCFAVLDSANAYVPGGAYVEGTYRRSRF